MGALGRAPQLTEEITVFKERRIEVQRGEEIRGDGNREKERLIEGRRGEINK